MSPRRTEITNPDLLRLIRFLRKKSRENEAAIWRRIAEMLSKPKRRRIAVNVSRINRYSKENDEVVVPGKVLGAGVINHPVKVAAFAFSDKARSKIIKAKGECLTIPELAEMNPKGSNVKIIG
ncbi:50S ribosomal protein L18e [Candidatus Bathyarchaeota archaeon]|nr:MAG: 50S ribosomal protein L18e [Candidatus Bathyarchaeota archaeon]